jgi:hypothetical protein
MAIVVLAVLAACGARVDTALTVNSDGSGSRVMTLTISAEDVSELVGGASAVDAAVNRRKPEGVTYDGVHPTADGGLTATFTLDFTDPADYQSKVDQLLQAGEQEPSDGTFTIPNSRFVKGISIGESFTSADLLQWVFRGLQADGVVSTGTSLSDMYELGDTTLTFGGATVEQGSAINYTATQDNGFQSAAVDTTMDADGKFTRVITLTLDPAKYQADAANYDSYFSTSMPSGATVAKSGDATWTVTVTGDAKTISDVTSTILDTPGATFETNTTPTPDDPASITLTVTDTASCSNVCSVETNGTVESTFTASDEFVQVSDGVFNLTPPFTSVTASANLPTSVTVTFTVDNASVDLVGDGFTTLLTPAPEIGTLSVDKGATNTTYTVTIEATDAAALSAAYGTWAPGGHLDWTEVEGSNFFRKKYAGSVNFALGSLTGNHPVTDGVTTAVHLPTAMKADAPLTSDAGDQPLYFTAAGYTLGGLCVAGALVLALIAAAVVLTKRRKQVAAHLRTATAKARAFREARLADEPGSVTALAGEHTFVSEPGPSLFEVNPPAATPRTSRSLFEVPSPAPRATPAASILTAHVETRSAPSARASVLDMTVTDSTRPAHASLLDREFEAATADH